MFKNTASQKLTLLAIDTAANVPKTGDAANLTAYVSKDDGSVTVLGDTSATELDATNAPGLYTFDLTQTETNADKLLFSGKSSTSGVRLVPLLVYTRPPAFASLVIANGCVDADVERFAGTAGTFASGRPEVNTTHVGGTSQTARDLGASVLLSSGTGTGQVTLTSGRVNADVTHVATAAVSTSSAQIGVNVVNAGGTAWGSGAITAASIASDAITAAKIADNAIDAGAIASDAITAAKIASDAITAAKIATGAITAAKFAAGAIDAAAIADGAIDEATFATTAGGFAPLNVIDQGTAQAATSTTIQLRSAAAFADDELIGARVLITGGSAGVGQSRLITDYVAATDTATVSAWTTTPSGTITYKVFGDTAAAGGGAPTAAEVADAVWDEARSGHAAAGSFGEYVPANVTAVTGNVSAADGLTLLGSERENDGYVTADAARVGGAVVGTSTAMIGVNVVSMGVNTVNASAVAADAVTEIQSGLSTLTAAGVRTAVGLASANLDTQLGTITGYIDTEVSDIRTRVLLALPAAVPGVDGGLYVMDSTGLIPADAQNINSGDPASAIENATAAALTAYGVAEQATAAAVKAKTDNLPSSPAAVGSAMTLTSGERAAVAAALLDLSNGVETSVTVRQALRAMAAALAGDVGSSGGSYKAVGNAGTTRLAVTDGGSGNRTVTPTL